MTATVKLAGSSWVAIMAGDGTTCLRHAIFRGRTGIEAFDRDDRSIGLVPTLADATAALASLVVPS
jgi:hypothetical protein